MSKVHINARTTDSDFLTIKLADIGMKVIYSEKPAELEKKNTFVLHLYQLYFGCP